MTLIHPENACVLHYSGADSSALEVATTTLETKTGEARRFFSGERICITDRRRTPRSLYIRLETWLSRELWAAEHELDGRTRDEVVLLWPDVHYIMHLRKRRPPCSACPPEIAKRLWLIQAEVKLGRR